MKKQPLIRRKASRAKATALALSIAPLVATLLEKYTQLEIPQDVLVSAVAGLIGLALYFIRDAVNRPGGDDPEALEALSD